ncbi:MAG TPA: nuclear transport factor 2 family protein [Steroidobacteraceae bacterium]|nr:nuclear transport factor 2 family protein [Steroidobacteraceae bacterium]
MKRTVLASIAAGLVLGCAQLHAQEPVVGVADPEALFHSTDPTLNTNLQATYHIIKDLIECGHWEMADRYLTARYIQHNPNARSGRAGVVYYFTKVMKARPKPIPARMRTKIVSVLAQGDLVVVAYPREHKDAKDPAKSYTTTWFDMWRFVDGKADEHWDPATRP